MTEISAADLRMGDTIVCWCGETFGQAPLSIDTSDAGWVWVRLPSRMLRMGIHELLTVRTAVGAGTADAKDAGYSPEHGGQW